MKNKKPTKLLSDNLPDKIINLLLNNGGSLRLLDISKALNIKSDSSEYEALVEQLNLLCEQSVLTKNTRRRYSLSLPDYSDGIIGTFNIDGKSLYVTTNHPDYPIITISNNNSNTAIIGDKVKVKLIHSPKKNKIKGKIIDIIERNLKEVSGKLHSAGQEFFLIPDNNNLKADFSIALHDLAGARDGDKVNCKVIS
jgi:ribonuclease R